MRLKQVHCAFLIYNLHSNNLAAYLQARKRKGTGSDPVEFERLQKEQQRLFREARERREAAAINPGLSGSI